MGFLVTLFLALAVRRSLLRDLRVFVAPGVLSPAMLKCLIEIGRDIKLAHSVFAMPFALLGAFIAARGMPTWAQLGLIVGCMVFARTFAMLANRWLDRRIDAANPRTAGRALPAGRLSATAVFAALLASAALLVLGAAGFWVIDANPWPLAASPIVLIWLFGYAWTKRFTALCHFALGAALAISPLAAGLAIAPASLAEPTLWLLAAFVLLWVGGFDIIYACQDIDFDRQSGLHSIPAKLGQRGALLVAKIAHLLALIALVAVGRVEPMLYSARLFGQDHVAWFMLATPVVAVLLIVEHRAASAGRFSMAFFTFNGVIALALGAAGIAEILGASR